MRQINKCLFILFITLLTPLTLLASSPPVLYGADTCFECAKVKEFFKEKQVDYIYYDISDPNNFKKYEQALAHFNLKGAPSPFLVRDGKAYAGYDAIISLTPTTIIREPSLLVVFLAGFVDGINPCALSLLLFILSLCLSKKLDIMKALLLYVVGIFATNYLIGTLLVLGYSNLTQYAKSLYLSMILLCTCLLALNFLSKWDVTKAFGLIKSKLTIYPFYIVIFMAAVLVAMLEFFCTSQIYLPSTLYIATTDNWALLLLGYNFFFILPMLFLIVIGKYGFNMSFTKLNGFISSFIKPISVINNLVLLLIILILIIQYWRL